MKIKRPGDLEAYQENFEGHFNSFRVLTLETWMPREEPDSLGILRCKNQKTLRHTDRSEDLMKIPQQKKLKTDIILRPRDLGKTQRLEDSRNCITTRRGDMI